MNWSNETFQDKIVNFMEKVRKNKIYLIATVAILIVAIIILLPKQNSKNDIQIELIGSEIVNLYVGDVYEELGFNAYDKNNKSYNDEVVIESNVNINLPGTYEVKYKIGKEEVTRTVIVLKKPIKYYEIILESSNEENDIYLKIDSIFEDPGYKILDQDGIDITDIVEVNVSGEVDTSKAGIYTLLYSFEGPNGEEISTKRDIVVIDNKLNLSLDKTTYTNSSIAINIEVIDDYFDYVELPNGEKIDKKEYSYPVNENGTYKFILRNEKGFDIEETIDVKYIDKEKPTGTCIASIKNGNTTVNIQATDNVAIGKYVINGNNYVSNEVVLTSEIKVVNVSLYDTAGNENKITCNTVKKHMTLTKNNNSTNYINTNIVVDIKVEDDDFSYLKLPTGSITYNKDYSFTITQNGRYTFTAYDKQGDTMEESINVQNIDKVLPTGTCYIKKNNTGTYIEINASDNIGIKNYVYSNKTYTSNVIDLTTVPSSATILVYDKANNKININCVNLAKPTINSITKDGVIINIKANKAGSDIAGYYFSYTNKRPDKSTGGYLATSNTSLDVVRLPGTTYVWVEDKSGNISDAKSITLSNDVLLDTKDRYTILQGTNLSTYLTNKGWSIGELNKLIARSSRAAGLYTKESSATAAVALQTVLAQKYQIKIPYWWGGKSWSFGGDSTWGSNRTTSSSNNDGSKTYYYYYGLDCSGFTAWAYVNAGYKIKSNTYPSFWSYSRVKLTKENGEIGDFLINSGHIKLIIGKADTGFITAEAKGKAYGMVVSIHPYTQNSAYSIVKGESLMNIYSKIDSSSYPSGF